MPTTSLNADCSVPTIPLGRSVPTVLADCNVPTVPLGRGRDDTVPLLAGGARAPSHRQGPDLLSVPTTTPLVAGGARAPSHPQGPDLLPVPFRTHHGQLEHMVNLNFIIILAAINLSTGRATL